MIMMFAFVFNVHNPEVNEVRILLRNKNMKLFSFRCFSFSFHWECSAQCIISSEGNTIIFMVVWFFMIRIFRILMLNFYNYLKCRWFLSNRSHEKCICNLKPFHKPTLITYSFPIQMWFGASLLSPFYFCASEIAARLHFTGSESRPESLPSVSRPLLTFEQVVLHIWL